MYMYMCAQYLARCDWSELYRHHSSRVCYWNSRQPQAVCSSSYLHVWGCHHLTVQAVLRQDCTKCGIFYLTLQLSEITIMCVCVCLSLWQCVCVCEREREREREREEGKEEEGERGGSRGKGRERHSYQMHTHNMHNHTYVLGTKKLAHTH